MSAPFQRGTSAVGQKIDQDLQRFRKLVRGKVKSNLSKYISRGEMIGKKGNDLVSIPLPSINLPQFRYGKKNSGGVGVGPGQPGQPLTQPQDGEGEPQAGDQPGGHILEVDLTLEELADILGEELALPRIQPRGERNIVTEKDKYTSIRNVGPESLRHFKRTYKRALKRQIAAGTYNPLEPRVIPVREDKQYRSWKETPKPDAVAAVIYMMDVSGSMTDEQKDIVRIEAFWIDTWIKKHYKGVETAYIIHDAVAQEVDEHTFYHTRESGGTKISSAYELCNRVIDTRYPPSQWNVYAFHFSDGDNWGDDVPKCIDLLTEQLLPKLNLFGYGQVESPYGSGEFFEHVHELVDDHKNVVVSRIPDREAILDSIKEFLKTGR
jgi:sporulation protein YhbH